MNLNKLKEAARKYEQREEWRRAIDVYLQAIREAEDAGEGAQDPGLYNRVGDLELKAGDTVSGLRAYEQAAELYAEQGFFNNAIALCQKILRVNPARTDTYLRLAQLHARKNFVGEAKKNLVEYLERQNAVGELDSAITALKYFAEQFSANPEIRLMLVELLRTTSRFREAREQLEKLASELEARGDARGARRTREQLEAINDEERSTPQRGGGDLVFIDTGVPVGPPPARPAPPREDLNLEPTALGTPADQDIPEGLVREPVWDDTRMEPVDELGVEPEPPGTAGPPALDFSPTGADLPSFDVDENTIHFDSADRPESPVGWPEEEEGGGEPGLPADSEQGIFDDVGSLDPAPPLARDRADMMYLQLEDTVAAGDPSLTADPGASLLERAREMLDGGDREGGRLALEEALKLFEAEGRWEEALQVAADLVRLDPDQVAGYQKQVEIAYRTGNRAALIAAYLELAEALVRLDAVDHALHVYRHILDHDPGNEAATAAVQLLEPVASNPEP
ncbi:MAG TPA: tetratricopeptide repeat protein, partial [Gemmatimonadales bacterium]|nr:tetratricopeptide repeat protein [Gemmatimonadales bacterium]